MSDGNKKSSKHKNSDGNSKRRILFSIVLDENYRSQGNSKIIRSKTNITVKLGEKKRGILRCYFSYFTKDKGSRGVLSERNMSIEYNNVCLLTSLNFLWKLDLHLTAVYS